MKDLLSKRISALEHILHIFLSFLTSGYWLIIYIIRALAYKQSKQSGESRVNNSSAVVRKSNKLSELKIGDYTKRTFATEDEAGEDEWFEYVEEYSFDVVVNFLLCISLISSVLFLVVFNLFCKIYKDIGILPLIVDKLLILSHSFIHTIYFSSIIL